MPKRNAPRQPPSRASLPEPERARREDAFADHAGEWAGKS